MATQETKRYLEMQMEELKATYGVTPEEQSAASKNSKDNREKNAGIAKLYEDAAEYQEDLKGFEEELEIVLANDFKNIATALRAKFPNEDRDYVQELQVVLENAWTNLVEVENTHSKEQLEIIKTTELSEVVEKLNSAYPDYSGDFEAEIREAFVKRWQTLIAIKKEHIKEEIAEIKIMGLKPAYVERIYKEYHGIE